MERSWTITQNKNVLLEYDNINIRKLLPDIFSAGIYRKCLERTHSKLIYECRDKECLLFYDVFINFVVPIPLRFWLNSLYQYEEIYPKTDDYQYRAWVYWDKNKAMKKYISLL